MKNVQITSSAETSSIENVLVSLDTNKQGQEVVTIMTECHGEGHAVDLTFDDVDMLVSVLRTLVPKDDNVARRIINIAQSLPEFIAQMQSAMTTAPEH